MQAKQSGADPFAAIESVLPWEAFIASVTEAEKLGQAEEFDYLRYIGKRLLGAVLRSTWSFTMMEAPGHLS